MMRWNPLALLMLCLWFAPCTHGQSAPARPARQRTVVVTTQPVAVPYTLTDTNHLLVRVKINGQGPFNFIVDTGSPVMILRIPAADQLKLKPDARGFATLNQLEIEGGITMRHVSCMIDTPYQIEGMNAIGASSVDLDGMLGYAIVSRFRMQIDLTRDRMIWTPVKYMPATNSLMRTSARDPTDPQEDRLESVGGLMKFLGPLIKPDPVQSSYRGLIGLELSEDNGVVSVARVLGGSPAAKAGVAVGDCVVSVDKTAAVSISEAQRAMAGVLPGQSVELVVRRGDAKLQLHITCAEGM